MTNAKDPYERDREMANRSLKEEAKRRGMSVEHLYKNGFNITFDGGIVKYTPHGDVIDYPRFEKKRKLL